MKHEPAILNVEELASLVPCPPGEIQRLAEYGRLNPHGPREVLGIKLPLVFLVRRVDLAEIRARLEAMRAEQAAGILPS